MKRLALALAVLMACWFSLAQAAEPTGPDALAGAVAVMRNVPAKGLTQEQMQAKSQDLDRVWKTLVAAGPKGSAALKDELAKLDAAGGKDDFFRLGAAALVWAEDPPAPRPGRDHRDAKICVRSGSAVNAARRTGRTTPSHRLTADPAPGATRQPTAPATMPVSRR